jgi:histidinol phosphatase-like PHP family hydrolase
VCLGQRADKRFCCYELYQHQCSYLDTKYTQSQVHILSHTRIISYYRERRNPRAERKQHNIVLIQVFGIAMAISRLYLGSLDVTTHAQSPMASHTTKMNR